MKVEAVYRDEKEAVAATAGENLRLRISGAEETDIMAGFVLSSIRNPVPMVTQFEAQVSLVMGPRVCVWGQHTQTGAHGDAV